MAKINRNNKSTQIAINLLSSIVSFVVSFGISFFLTPYVVEKIGSDAYGFVGLANNFVHYASIVTAALNSMAGRFITMSIQKEDKEDTAKYISSVLIANVVLAVPLSVILGWIIVNMEWLVKVPANILADVRLLWLLIFVGFIVSLISSVFSVAPFAKNRLDITSGINIVSNIVRALLLLGSFLLFSPRVWYIGLASFICSIISAVWNYIAYKKMFPDIKIKRALAEWERIKILVSSGIWNSISQLCSIVLEELDLLITDLFVNASSMGVVSIAKSMPTRLLSFFVIFGNAFSPQITIDYANEDYEAVKNDILSAVRLICFCSSIPLVWLYIMGQEFFKLWMPGQDSKQLYIIAILACLEFPLVVPLEPMWKVFTAANKTKQTATVAIITALVSVTTTFGLLSVATDEFQKMCIIVGVSSTIGLFRGAFFLPLYGAHCIHMKWTTFYPVLFKNIISLAIGCLVALGIKQIVTIDSWISLIGAIIISSLILAIFNFYLVLTKKDRRTLLKKLHIKVTEK